jgi:hypothetical protein
MRKAFNFYRSYWEVAQELNDKDRLAFYDALLKKQFTGIENELSGMAKFAFISQKHSIDQQIKGYFDKTKDPSVDPCQGGSVGGYKAPSVQEKEKEKGKHSIESDEIEFNIFWNAYDKKVDRTKCLKAYLKLPKQIRGIIYDKATSYRLATPEVKFRKNPLTWLNGKCWEDETPQNGKKEIHAFHNQIFD